jgi:hypothetical protein
MSKIDFSPYQEVQVGSLKIGQARIVAGDPAALKGLAGYTPIKAVMQLQRQDVFRVASPIAADRVAGPGRYGYLDGRSARYVSYGQFSTVGMSKVAPFQLHRINDAGDMELLFNSSIIIPDGPVVGATFVADKVVIVTADQTRVATLSRGGELSGGTVTYSLPVAASWGGACSSGTRAVITGSGSNKAVYSDNGIVWTSTTLPVSGTWAYPAYGGGRFTLTQTSSTAAFVYSADGASWSVASFPSSGVWTAICFGAEVFVAAKAGTSTVAYSTNLTSWTTVVLPTTAQWKGLAYVSLGDGVGKPGVFVLYGTSASSVLVSLDGMTWNETYSIQSQMSANVRGGTVTGVDPSTGSMLIVGADTKTFYSVDVARLVPVYEMGVQFL